MNIYSAHVVHFAKQYTDERVQPWYIESSLKGILNQWSQTLTTAIKHVLEWYCELRHIKVNAYVHQKQDHSWIWGHSFALGWLPSIRIYEKKHLKGNKRLNIFSILSKSLAYKVLLLSENKIQHYIEWKFKSIWN